MMKSRYNRQDQANSVFSVLYLNPFDEHNNNCNNNCNNNEYNINDENNNNKIALMDINGNKGKEFWHLFRVPFNEFVFIANGFSSQNKMKDVSGCPAVDCHLLVLGLLWFLAWGVPFKQLEELSQVSEFTHCYFFLEEFLPWGCRLACNNIYLPRTPNKLTAVENKYRRKGLPGCVGSVDCVHVQWDRCPSGFKGECHGKAGTPTLAFEVVVAHDRRIQSVSTYNPGAQNDKTIAQNDNAIAELRRQGTFLSNQTFEPKCPDGTTRTHHRSYVICNGGYCQWTCLILPFKDQTETSEFYGWSKQVEGLRKDVECTFGILKKCFMVLKNPIRFEKPGVIQDMFVTCCAMHNALLEYDHPEDDINQANENNDVVDGVGGHGGQAIGSFMMTTNRQFHERRQALVNHYNICANEHSIDLN